MKNNSTVDWKDNLSKSIDLLRFPLAVWVLYAHMGPTMVNSFTADFPFFSWHGIYNFLGFFLSKAIGIVTVPTFFMISGYLFFANFKEWSWEGYKKKINSRFRTLILPYIVWNILAFVLIILNGLRKGEYVQDYISNNWRSFLWNCNVWDPVQYSWLPWETYGTGPVDLPLWFLRDLIVVSILSPLIFWLIKKTRIWGMIVLFAVYLSYFWVAWDIFSITSLFFFSLGAYFAINGLNFVLLARKYMIVLIALSVASFGVYFFYFKIDADIVGISRNLFVLFSVFFVFIVASLLVEKKNAKPNKVLISTCFFIYAEHKCAPIDALGWTDVFIHKLIPGEGYWEDTICLIIVPFIAAYLLVGICLLMKRFTPRIAGLLSGNR